MPFPLIFMHTAHFRCLGIVYMKKKSSRKSRIVSHKHTSYESSAPLDMFFGVGGGSDPHIGKGGSPRPPIPLVATWHKLSGADVPLNWKPEGVNSQGRLVWEVKVGQQAKEAVFVLQNPIFKLVHLFLHFDIVPFGGGSLCPATSLPDDPEDVDELAQVSAPDGHCPCSGAVLPRPFSAHHIL